MTLTLNELQKKFVSYLVDYNHDVLNYIQSSVTLSAQQHIAIYHRSIFGAKQNVLKDIYSVCLKLVGHDFFMAMINEYITEIYSMSPDLGEYGETLPTFISQFPPVQSLPYLADVARLEWTWHRVYSADECKQLDFDKLSSVYETAGENIVFLLPPDSVLISSPFPVHRIWEMNQDSYTGETTLSLEKNQPFYFLIWRKQLEMRIDLLSQAEWQLLFWIQQKLTLGQIAEEIEKYMTHYRVNFSIPC